MATVPRNINQIGLTGRTTKTNSFESATFWTVKKWLLVLNDLRVKYCMHVYSLSFCYVLAWPPGICLLGLSREVKIPCAQQHCHGFGTVVISVGVGMAMRWVWDQESTLHRETSYLATMQLTVGWELNKYITHTSFDGWGARQYVLSCSRSLNRSM